MVAIKLIKQFELPLKLIVLIGLSSNLLVMAGESGFQPEVNQD